MDPLNELRVVSQDRPGPPTGDGWEYSPIDLNQGAGGRFIYAGWKRGAANVVTRLGFHAGGQMGGPWPDWEWSPQDLNEGAEGDFIYMMWQRNPRYSPIYHITFVVTPSDSPPPLPGYSPIAVDLNRGAGGPYIWPYVSYAPQGFDKKLTTRARTVAGVIAMQAMTDRPKGDQNYTQAKA